MDIAVMESGIAQSDGDNTITKTESVSSPSAVSINNNCFPKSRHIRHAKDFELVYKKKVAYNNGVLLVFVGENALGFPRLGLSVSKKAGRAHRRNLWKRLIREAFRLQQREFVQDVLKIARHEKRADLTQAQLAGIDIIVIPRKTEEKPDFKEVKKSLKYCVKRAAGKLFNLESAGKSKKIQSQADSAPQPPEISDIPADGSPL